MKEQLLKNLRATPRLSRQPDHIWQLKVNEDELITKNIIDISPTGISFKAPLRSEFKSGQKLRFQLSLYEGDEVECEGEVVWARKNGSMQQLGVQFSKLPQRVDANIMREIHALSVRKLPDATTSGGLVPPEHIERAHSVLRTVVRISLLVLSTIALVWAVYLHQSEPGNSLAERFGKSFSIRKSGF